MRDSGSRLVCLIGGGLIGVAITALAAARAAEGEGVGVMPTPFETVAGGLGGALCGFTLWALWEPSRRIPQVAVTLAVLNCATWLLFLAANARVSDGGAAIIRHREHLDHEASRGWPNGVTFVSHPSTLLAGRSNSRGTLSEKPLALFAGPAVDFAHDVIVPTRYWQTGATVPESDWIAAAAFVLSTAWWVAAGSLIRFWRQRRVPHKP
jgi:hypothetical protein